jgi:PTS system glucose-specific IIA component
MGIDTVTLKGEGFTGHRQAGDMVSRGDVIISCDLDAIRTKVPSMVTPVLLTIGAKFSMSSPDFHADGASVITVRRK